MNHTRKTLEPRLMELLRGARGRSGAQLALAQVETLAVAPVAGANFGLAMLAGRMVELSSDGATGASMSIAIGIVAEAHAVGEPAAWIRTGDGVFYPPDAVEAGVDLAALVVVRVTDARSGGRAADQLMRSGGFGAVVLDLGDGAAAARGITPALLARLHALAERHRCALICLTDKKAGAPSLGTGVSLRAETRLVRRDGTLGVEVNALKDRRGAPGWSFREVRRGPAGMR